MKKTDKIKKLGVLQHDSSDCGVACLVTAIRYYGGDSTIERIRRMSGTDQTGTTLLGLYQAAGENGLEATGYEAGIDDIRKYDNLLILHVLNDEGLEHYILCIGYDSQRFIIWDPAVGLQFTADDRLKEIWKSGKCLGLIPGKTFKYKNENKKSKWKWLLRTVGPEKELLIISAIAGVFISALGLVMAIFTQKLIDKILPAKDIKILVLTTVLVFVLLSTRIILTSLRQYFLLTQGRIFNVRIVDEFYRSLLSLPRIFFDTRKTGDFVARMNDTTRIQHVIADITGVYIIDILILVITVPVIFYYSLTAGIISLVSLPLIYLLVARWNGKIKTGQHSVMAGYALSESNFINSLEGITEIKSMIWQETFGERNKGIYSDFQGRVFDLGKIKIKLSLITGLSGTFYLVVILLMSALQVIDSAMTDGELMAIISLSSSLLPSVLNLALISIPFSEARVALNRMFEYTLMEPETDGESENSGLAEIRRISINNISFRFPGRKLLLDDISLIIEKGKIVSLVGESGCGKSTLANIILRFYSQESGDIIINGNIVSDKVDLQRWRSKIGIIPQEIHIFNGTILQNLITDLSDSEIKEMVTTVTNLGISGFFDNFPAGLMTVVGEEGINLSGGQKQVIAFTRVLLNNPDILVIDEGTSNMDRGTEGIISDLLLRLRPAMGMLMISHRVNMIKKLSDYIYVMEDRVISDHGTHEELIGRDNIYKRFWDDFY